MSYSQPITQTFNHGALTEQRGWTIWNLQDGSPLLQIDDEAGQLILHSASDSTDVRFSFAIHQRTDDVYLYVQSAKLDTQSPKPHVNIELSTSANAKANPPKSVDLMEILIAATEGREVIHV